MPTKAKATSTKKTAAKRAPARTRATAKKDEKNEDKKAPARKKKQKYFDGVLILEQTERVVNGREYTYLKLADGTTKLLPEDELKEGLS